VNDQGEPAEIWLDAAGLRCPLPVIRLAALVQNLPDGRLVAVHSTDPAAGPDIAAWCRMRGHELVEQLAAGSPTGGSRSPGHEHGLVSRVRVRRTAAAER